MAEQHVVLGVEVAGAVLDGDGECAYECREVWARGEGGDGGEVAGDGGKGKMTIEQAARAGAETVACAGKRRERGDSEGLEDGVEELDGEAGEGHGGRRGEGVGRRDGG